jgi:hypothetical protein
MPLLIDGYNLLHASGILPRGLGPGTLERARGALLNFLAGAIDAAELPQTTIVFDAKDAPPGLPDVYDHGGMLVRFARGYEDADLLLIELIRADSAPRKLTVVSSDHQVQRAARRRRAEAIDSDRWCAELLRRRRLPDLSITETEADSKPPAPLSEAEVRSWLKEFGDVELSVDAFRPPNRIDSNEQADGTQHTGQPADAQPTYDADDKNERHAFDSESVLDEAKRLAQEDAHLANPFPPGYAEDLLDDDA